MSHRCTQTCSEEVDNPHLSLANHHVTVIQAAAACRQRLHSEMLGIIPDPDSNENWLMCICLRRARHFCMPNLDF